MPDENGLYWQDWTHARKRLWALVAARFAGGKRQITLTRDDLVEEGVFGDFGANGKPLPPRQREKEGGDG